MQSLCCPKGPGVVKGHPSVIWPLTFALGDFTQKGELQQSTRNLGEDVEGIWIVDEQRWGCHDDHGPWWGGSPRSQWWRKQSRHSQEAETRLPHLLLRLPPSLLLPPCPLSPSPLPERVGPWAWISVKPWRENAPWNYTAPAKGAAICFSFRPFPCTQGIKPFWSGAASPSW